jgi:hypothetical protein
MTEPMSSTDSETLATYGLKRVGIWEFGKYGSTRHLKHLPGIQFNLAPDFGPDDNIVYAILIDSRVFYVGQTTNGLRD